MACDRRLRIGLTEESASFVSSLQIQEPAQRCPGWSFSLSVRVRPGRGLLERCDGLGLVIIDIEDCVELGQLKQVMNLLGQL
jgi:hypothetical protein